MKTEQPILITTVPVTASYFGVPYSFTRFSVVDMNGGFGNPNNPSLGVCMEDHTFENDSDTFELPVCCQGIVLVKTGAAVAKSLGLEQDGNGCVVPLSTGFLVGVSLDAASGAGELIRVLLK